jgi:DNA-binding response OmpR family regulator
MNEGLPMKQILLVEDDRDIAALRLNLEDEGYAITREADGSRALLLLEQSSWDTVILDLMLPSVDGLKFAVVSVR